jgi:Domain of unknown function (DUF4158)
MPRMNILNAVEQEAFESAPVFTSFQRKQHFDFPQAIQQATANLRTPANQLCFLLSCGYFKASKRFFPAQTFHPRDVEYVVGRTGLRLEQIERSNSISMPRKPRRDIGASSWTSTASSHSVSTAAPYLPKKSHVCCGPRSSPRSSSGAVSMS